MENGDLLARIERLNLVLPQIVRRMQRIPTSLRPAPAVSLPQLRMMLLLEMEGPSTMGELARRASVTMPTATSSINALVESRHVSRRRDEHDRRVVVVSVTAKGRRVLDALHGERRQVLSSILTRLGPDDQRRLVEAFESILNVLRKLDDSPASEPQAGQEADE